jgi:ABC-type amino acid transport substrate-binding protein
MLERLRQKLQSRAGRQPRLFGDAMTLVVVFGLLSLVYLLPADTSLSQLKASGRLQVCMPTEFPPLVTRNPSAPGFDVELLTEVAHRLGVRFAVSPNSAIGRDFNPRSWRVTRAAMPDAGRWRGPLTGRALFSGNAPHPTDHRLGRHFKPMAWPRWRARPWGSTPV